MSQRTQAGWRILSAAYGATVGATITGVVGLVAIVWGVVDILWQLLTNRNDLSENSTPAKVVYNTLHWNLDLFVFFATGEGMFQWLPDW